MKSLLAVLSLALAASLAAAESVNIQVVTLDGDTLSLDGGTHQVAVTKQVPVTRAINVNGVIQNVTELRTVTVMETRAGSVKLKDVTAYDLDGLKVDPEKLPELLKKPRAVVISGDGKLPKSVRDVLKDGTLVLVVQKVSGPQGPRAPGK